MRLITSCLPGAVTEDSRRHDFGQAQLGLNHRIRPVCIKYSLGGSEGKCLPPPTMGVCSCCTEAKPWFPLVHAELSWRLHCVWL